MRLFGLKTAIAYLTVLCVNFYPLVANATQSFFVGTDGIPVKEGLESGALFESATNSSDSENQGAANDFLMGASQNPGGGIDWRCLSNCKEPFSGLMEQCRKGAYSIFSDCCKDGGGNRLQGICIDAPGIVPNHELTVQCQSKADQAAELCLTLSGYYTDLLLCIYYCDSLAQN